MATSGPPKSSLDLNVSGLRESLKKAAAYYAPEEVRDIVCALFTGQNYRRLTERPTRQAISVIASWLLNICHSASIAHGDRWTAKLLETVSRKRASQEEKWLRFWLLGITQKTAVNLGVKSSELSAYLERVKKATAEVVPQLAWSPTCLQLFAKSLKSIKLSPEDSVWLLQIAGAAALTIRGSKKSIAGKRLEKAIARAALASLGLVEGQHFWLNVERDQEVEREVDAEILTRRGRARMDIALIGTGNQEVSEDKLARVGRNGVVLVDTLGPKSQVLKNAARHEVKVIQLRNNFALSDLYGHLESLIPNGVSLTKPPAEDYKIRNMLTALPLEVFQLPRTG